MLIVKENGIFLELENYTKERELCANRRHQLKRG